nr:MAG TPA: hypothetical protein [Bacteriophage sp.]
MFFLVNWPCLWRFGNNVWFCDWCCYRPYFRLFFVHYEETDWL